MIQTVKLCNAKVITSRFVLILVPEERPVTTAAGKLCLDDGSSEGEKNNSKHCYNFFYAAMSKLVRSRWLDIGQVFFFAFLWTETKSRSIKTQKKKRTRPISNHLVRTSLVNKGFIIWPKGYTKYLLRRAGEYFRS